MDIERHILLRSYVKPSAIPMAKAIGLALFIHSLLFVYWQPIEQLSVAEIPDWINIKLIAGFEENENIPASNLAEEVKAKEIKKQSKIREQKNKIKKNFSEDNINNKQKVKEKTSSTGSATAFIKADSRPYTLENPKPVYPAAARRRGMQGTVLLSVKLNKEGYVKEINILQTSGFRALDRSAVNSVENWRFIPAFQGEQAVASIVEIPIRFTLDKTI